MGKSRRLYKYFDHEADVGIIGTGATLQQAFEQAAKAMFDLMVDIDKVVPRKEIQVRCQASNIEELFVEWLNALLTEAGLHDMVFSDFKIEELEKLQLVGHAKGEDLAPERHNLKTEVKAATYAMLAVEKQKDQYIARCVVDV